ncbi:MAG: hypothetical protein ACKOQY_06335 [Bacteroidota bacterium]
MKHLFTFVLLMGIIGISQAQNEIRNKKGVLVTPEAGEFSVGIDAVPFLRFAGSLFNDGSSPPSNDFTAGNPLTITGRYMKTADFAYRGKLRLGFGTSKSEELVPRIGSTNPNEKVSDETKVTSSNIAIGAGLQKWRVKSRVRGYYGEEAMIGVSTLDSNFTYGNPLGAENQVVRKKSNKQGSAFSFQVRGLAGVEYFFAAKVSLSAEFGWGPTFQSVGRGELQEERWNGTAAEAIVSNSGKSSSFSFDNDNAAGAINLNVYF